MGATVSTLLRLRNLSSSDVRAIYAYEVDSYDFGPNLRPDKQFDGIPLPAGTCIEKLLDIKTSASKCPFTMKLIYDDDTEDVFCIHYKYAYDETDPEFRHLSKTHPISYHKTTPRVLEIIVKDSEQQIQNYKAEELNKEALQLMQNGKYEESAVKFNDAIFLASKDATLSSIHENYERLQELTRRISAEDAATRLNAEGLQFLDSNKFDDALNKFREALDLATNPQTRISVEDNMKLARQAKINRDAKKLNQEGLRLKKNGENEEALRKFEGALRLATDQRLEASIKLHQAETLKNLAKETLDKAWSLEISDCDESIDQFSKAKYLFQLSDSIKTCSGCMGAVELIDCKLEGYKSYNQGVQLENEAGRCENPQEVFYKYQGAQKHYKTAIEKYETGVANGDVNFNRCLIMTSQALQRVDNLLKQLNCSQLSSN